MVGLTPSFRETNPPRKLSIPCNKLIKKSSSPSENNLGQGLPRSQKYEVSVGQIWVVSGNEETFLFSGLK